MLAACAWQIEMQCSNNCNQCATNQVTTSTSDCHTRSRSHSHSHFRSHCCSHDIDDDGNKLPFNFQCNFNWNLILIDFPQHFLASLLPTLSALGTRLWFVPRLAAHEAILCCKCLRCVCVCIFQALLAHSARDPFLFSFGLYLSFLQLLPPLPLLLTSIPSLYFLPTFSTVFFNIFGALYERANDWNVIKNCTANAAANAFSKHSPRAACSILCAPRGGISWLQVF